MKIGPLSADDIEPQVLYQIGVYGDLLREWIDREVSVDGKLLTFHVSRWSYHDAHEFLTVSVVVRTPE